MKTKARFGKDRLTVVSRLEKQIEAKVDGGKGDTPKHEWTGTQLRFQKPNGQWGEYVDLEGPDGQSLELRLNGYELEYRVVGDTNWIPLGNVRGPDGRQVELSLVNYVLRWRYQGDLEWVSLGDVRGPAGPGIASGGGTGQVLRKKSNSDFDTEWVNDTPSKVKELPMPIDSGGPLGWDGASFVILSRSGSVFPTTNLFDGRLFKIFPSVLSLRIAGVDQTLTAGAGVYFEYNASRAQWRPLGGRFNLISLTINQLASSIATIGTTTAQTELIRVSIPGGLIVAGCTLRFKGNVVGSSSTTNAYAVALNIHQSAGGTQFSLGARSVNVINGNMMFQWNKGVRVGSTTYLQSGPVNIEADVAGGAAVNLGFVSAVDVITQPFFISLFGQKGATTDVLRLTSFEIDVEYPN